jgi:hypothetical protein
MERRQRTQFRLAHWQSASAIFVKIVGMSCGISSPFADRFDGLAAQELP